MAVKATMSIGLAVLMLGTTKPMNMAYNAIPIPLIIYSGIQADITSPAIVPRFQKLKAIRFKPSMNRGLISPFLSIEATAKVSSVMPKASRGRSFFEVPFSKFCAIYEVMRKCLRFNMKVANTISIDSAPRLISLIPTNWLAPANTIKDISIATKSGIPRVFANTPKAMAIGRYPIAIGTPAFNPLLKLVLASIILPPTCPVKTKPSISTKARLIPVQIILIIFTWGCFVNISIFDSGIIRVSNLRRDTMPALATHYLCGNTTFKLLELTKPEGSLLKHRNVYNLGTQGPDIFFYCGALPRYKGKGISELGEGMHEKKTGAFILEALKYVSEACEPAKGMLTAYMYGFLCHYILDCHTHPYIFYKSGFLRKGEAYMAKFTCYHRMFETALDVLMLEQELGIKPPRFNAAAQIRVSAQTAAEIGKMYKVVINKVYGINISIDTVCDAIASVADISSLLRDRTGIKKLLLSQAEKALGKPPLSSSMILPLRINDGLDYLNSSHSAWYLPWDNSVALTCSFTENFEAAASEAKKIIEMTELFLMDRIRLDSIASAVGNRSYLTGRDCDSDLEFRYFDCIFLNSGQKIY